MSTRSPPSFRLGYRGFKVDNLVVEVTFRFGEKTESWHNQFIRIATDQRPQIKGHIVSAWANLNSDYTKKGFVLEHVGQRGEPKKKVVLPLDHRPLQCEAGPWYTAVLEVVDDEVLFRMGEHVTYGKSDTVRIPKTLVSLTLGTTWHEIKRVRIWHAEANPEWKFEKQRILDSRKSLPISTE